MVIRKLDPQTCNQIAAGEVIENPSSVVKELVENAFDAGARHVKIIIKGGGLKEISVIDDGSGIPSGELRLAVERHTTSKIKSIKDLETINSMGFRGEALPSIASISRMIITTRYREEETGSYISLEGGSEKAFQERGFPVGTKVTVKDLFYNTPVRKKFLKGIISETARITRVVQFLALSRPDVSISLIRDNKTILMTPGDGNLFNVILSIYGSELGRLLFPLENREDTFCIAGYISSPAATRNTRNYQVFFVNQRYVHSTVLREALDRAYGRFITAKRYSLAFLHLYLPSGELDVNVHPTKIDVKFHQEEKVRAFVENSLEKALKQVYISPSNPGSRAVKQKESLNVKQYNLKTHGEEIQDTGNKRSAFKEEVNLNFLPIFPSEIEMKHTFTMEKGNNNYDEAIFVLQDRENNRLAGAGVLTDFPGDDFDLFKNEITASEVVGQIFNTYILLQQGENIFFVDQHAAHERVIWEKIIKDREKGKKLQHEIIPFSIELPLSLAEEISEKLGLLAELGLKIERFGNNTFIVRAVPYLVKDLFKARKIMDLLDRPELISLSGEQFQKEALLQISCKAAIKANQPLSREEIYSLIKMLGECKNPYLCPHGRPVFLKFSKRDLEKLFKRRG